MRIRVLVLGVLAVALVGCGQAAQEGVGAGLPIDPETGTTTASDGDAIDSGDGGGAVICSPAVDGDASSATVACPSPTGVPTAGNIVCELSPDGRSEMCSSPPFEGTGEVLCLAPGVPATEPLPPGVTCDVPSEPTSPPDRVEARPGTRGARPVPWQSAEPGPADAGPSLVVVWGSGVEPCYVLDRIDVVETATEVKVTVWQGADPRSSPEVPCIAVGLVKSAVAPLAAPLGTRTVVDGAPPR